MPHLSALAQRRVSLDEIEREYIKAVLEEVGGSKSQAAKILGINRKTLYRKLKTSRAARGVR